MFFLICFAYFSGNVYACQDPIPAWIVQIEVPNSKTFDPSINRCLDTECIYTYEFQRSQKLQSGLGFFGRKDPYGGAFVRWIHEKSMVLLTFRFMLRKNAEFINGKKNSWIEPLGKLTKIETGSLEKIWPEVFQQWESLKAIHINMTYTKESGPQELTLTSDEKSLFSCDSATKTYSFENWNIKFDYSPKHCINIPIRANFCEYQTKVPMIYLIIGFLLTIYSGSLLFRRLKQKNSSKIT